MDNYQLLLIILASVFGVLFLVIIVLVSCWYLRKNEHRGRSRRRAGYENQPLIDRLSQPRIQRTQAQEQTSLLTCHFYIRTRNEYAFHSQLSQLGSDPEKSWFLVTPTTNTTTRSSNVASHILTINPKSDRLSHLTDENNTAVYIQTLNSLVGRLHHPYVEPIVQLNFLYAQQLVITVKRYQRFGSLKDLLHGITPTANFHGKYSYRSSGLSLNLVRLYSCQLLKGLLFLRSKSMPPMLDLHSGNIIATGSCVQIGSYEYSFLEQRSRIYPLIKRATSSLILPEGMTKGQASEVFCFGSLIFEMLTGYEIGGQLRGLTPKHWHDCGRDPNARQMLTRLFDVTQPVLTLEEIQQLPYFSSSPPKMTELQSYTPMPGEMPVDVKTLLEQWATTTRKKRNASARASTMERRKTLAAVKQSDVSIMNLSYTPTTSITPLSPPTTTSNLPGPTSSPLPPPPPPPPPPTAASSPAPTSGSGDRGALLGDIRLGAKLKKTVTNDRSSPKV